MAARVLAESAFVLLALFFAASHVQGMSNGAPAEACGDLTQSHSPNSAQPSQIPYLLNIDEFSAPSGGYEYTPSTTYNCKFQSCSNPAAMSVVARE